MRKLAPAVLMTSMLAFAGGAFANSSDKVSTAENPTGSPTVSGNKSTGEPLSYSDKSNTSTGTNAKLDKTHKKSAKAKAKHDAHAGMTTDSTVSTPAASAPMASSPSSLPSPSAGVKADAGARTDAAVNSTTGSSPR
jgi:hypothetical protein